MLTGLLPEPRMHKHIHYWFSALLHESQTPLLHGSSSLDGLLSGCYEPTHRVHDNTHGVHMIGESSTTRKRWSQAAPPNSLISQCICGRMQSATSSTYSTFCSRSLAGNAVLHTSYCPPVRAISCFFDCSCFNNGASNGEWLLSCGPCPRWFHSESLQSHVAAPCT